jgi:hypothetical protein
MWPLTSMVMVVALMPYAALPKVLISLMIILFTKIQKIIW